MTADSTLGDCCASIKAWESSENGFYLSVSSAAAAGRYSTTTLSILSRTTIVFDYSYVPYTSTDQTSLIKISSFPTASRTSTWVETVTSVLEPIAYTGKYPTCDDSSCYSCDPKRCTISADRVQLNYWPPSTVSGYPNLTVTSNATDSVTTVVKINGTTFTFTSPTVYLSYAAVSAVDGCSGAVGKSYPGAVIGVSSNAISSIESPHAPANTFNFANLNKPYSPEVLYQLCWPEPQELCEVPADAVYNPQIVVPMEIRALDPAWKSCDPDFFGSYDPPRILEPAPALVNPTPATGVKATSSAATPAPTVKSQGAASTSKLDAGKSSPSESLSAMIPPDQHPSAVDPSDPKPAFKSTPAANTPISEAPSKDLPAQSQNRPSKTEAVESTSARALTTTLSNSKPPAQNTPSTNPLAQDPTIIDLSLKDPPTPATTASDLSINDPPARIPAASFTPTNTPLTNEVPPRLSLLDNSHRKDPTVLLPHLTVDSQIFTADTSGHYVIDSKIVTPGGEITVSGTPISVPHLSLSTEVSPTSLPALIVGSQSFTANHASHYIIGSQTLTTGGHITVAGTPVSAPTLFTEIHNPVPTIPSLLIFSETYSPSASAIVIEGITKTSPPALASSTALNSKTIALVIGDTTTTLVPTFSLPPLTIGSKIYVADSRSQYIIGSQTLTPKGQIIVAGTTVSLLPSASAVIIDSVTNTLEPIPALPPLTVGTKTYTADSASQYIISHQTLTLGGHITIAGTSISLDSESPALASESNEEPLFSRFALPLITVGSEIYTANPASAYIIKDQTLTPGGQISIDGRPVSLAPQASVLVVGSSTEALSHLAFPTLTINSKVYAANPASAYIIEGQTLTPGGQISVDGKSISLASQAAALVIGSVTETLLTSFALPHIIVDSEVNTANSASAYIIKGQTLTAGGQITVEGTPVSLAPNASDLVIGSNTQSFSATSSTVGLGQVIMEGFDGGRGSGGDGGHEGADGSSGGSRVTTNVTSVTNTSVSTPSQTASVFVGGASRRWTLSWIELATMLSAILITLH